jgi:predicted N-acyltransferase
VIEAELVQGLGVIDPGAWAALDRAGDVDTSWACLRFREQVEPGASVVLTLDDATGVCAAACGVLTTPETALTSHPWKLLGSEQMLRIDGAQDGDAVRAEHAALVSRAVGGDHGDDPVALLTRRLGPVLVIRGIDRSQVLLAAYLPDRDRRRATELLITGAQRHVMEGLAGAIAFPFVVPADELLAVSLASAGFQRLLITAVAGFDVGGHTSVEAFHASLPSSARRHHRREPAALAAAGLTITEIPLAEHADRVAALEAQNIAKYGGQPAPDRIAQARRMMAGLLGDAVRVGAVYRDDQLIACGLYLLGRSRCLSLSFGCDYTVADRATAYPCLTFYQPVARAIHERVPEVRLGFEGFQAKVQRGSRLVDREMWLWVPDSGCGERLEPLLRFVDGRTRKHLDKYRKKMNIGAEQERSYGTERTAKPSAGGM